MTNSEKAVRGVSQKYRWELIEAFRSRANQSANIVRSFVFALNSGGIYFVANKYFDAPSYHLFSVAAFAAAIAVVIWSWDVQKRKATERLVTLRDNGYAEYLKLEGKYRRSIWDKNYIIDRIAYCLTALGFIIELAPKLYVFLR